MEISMIYYKGIRTNSYKIYLVFLYTFSLFERSREEGKEICADCGDEVLPGFFLRIVNSLCFFFISFGSFPICVGHILFKKKIAN